MNITEQTLYAAEIRNQLGDLAKLRIDIFQEYPYLYRGEQAYERTYLDIYAESADALAIVAHDGNVLAGAVTAIPLKDEMTELTVPFNNTPYPLEQIFYIGELLFYSRYRNSGMGSRLIAQVEAYVRSLKRYRFLTCATVVRPDEHPQIPANYLPIDSFLLKNGFQPLAGVTAAFSWPELDGISRSHSMQFWLKRL